MLINIRQALASLLLTNTAQLTLQHSQKKEKVRQKSLKIINVFTGGPYGRLAIMLNTLSSLNTEIIIFIIIIITKCSFYMSNSIHSIFFRQIDTLESSGHSRKRLILYGTNCFYASVFLDIEGVKFTQINVLFTLVIGKSF